MDKLIPLKVDAAIFALDARIDFAMAAINIFEKMTREMRDYPDLAEVAAHGETKCRQTAFAAFEQRDALDEAVGEARFFGLYPR